MQYTNSGSFTTKDLVAIILVILALIIIYVAYFGLLKAIKAKYADKTKEVLPFGGMVWNFNSLPYIFAMLKFSNDSDPTVQKKGKAYRNTMIACLVVLVIVELVIFLA